MRMAQNMAIMNQQTIINVQQRCFAKKKKSKKSDGGETMTEEEEVPAYTAPPKQSSGASHIDWSAANKPLEAQ